MATQTTNTPSGQASTKNGDGNSALNIEMRRVISDAYAFVRGNDWNKYAANLTYEELLSLAIDRIDGSQKMGNTRATRLDRIASIKSSIAAAVTTVKAKPPSAWGFETYEPADAVEHANTPEDET
jgi:hypothetical protein